MQRTWCYVSLWDLSREKPLRIDSGSHSGPGTRGHCPKAKSFRNREVLFFANHSMCRTQSNSIHWASEVTHEHTAAKTKWVGVCVGVHWSRDTAATHTHRRQPEMWNAEDDRVSIAGAVKFTRSGLRQQAEQVPFETWQKKEKPHFLLCCPWRDIAPQRVCVSHQREARCCGKGPDSTVWTTEKERPVSQAVKSTALCGTISKLLCSQQQLGEWIHPQRHSRPNGRLSRSLRVQEQTSSSHCGKS